MIWVNFWAVSAPTVPETSVPLPLQTRKLQGKRHCRTTKYMTTRCNPRLRLYTRIKCDSVNLPHFSGICEVKNDLQLRSTALRTNTEHCALDVLLTSNANDFTGWPIIYVEKAADSTLQTCFGYVAVGDMLWPPRIIPSLHWNFRVGRQKALTILRCKLALGREQEYSTLFLLINRLNTPFFLIFWFLKANKSNFTVIIKCFKSPYCQYVLYLVSCNIFYF